MRLDGRIINPYARAALAAYSNRSAIMRAYSNYGPYALRAGRMIGRAARAYLNRRKRAVPRGVAKPRKRARVGQRVGTGASKRTEVIKDNTARRTYELYPVELTKIEGESAIYEIDKRQRPLINLRGIKLCMETINNTNNMLYMNLALISYRCPTPVTEIPLKFFRSTPTADPGGTERSIDFDNNTLTGMDHHCRPINNDIRTVHFHYRYKLGPNGDGVTTRSQKTNTLLLQKYIPIKRQVRYNDGDPLSCSTPIFLTYWFSEPGDAEPVVQRTNAANVDIRCLTYFKDTH